MIPPGLEPGTFRVLGERDNHYTTESWEAALVLHLWNKITSLVDGKSMNITLEKLPFSWIYNFW